MPIADPPTNVPWFPDGDPLLRPPNVVSPFHRLIDPYETYDLLVTFKNVTRANVFTYLNEALKEDNLELFHHPLVPYRLQFSNTKIYCYDRLTPQEYPIAANYILKMRELVLAIWNADYNNLETPTGIFTANSETFTFTAEETETIIISYYHLEFDDCYSIATIKLPVIKGEEYLVEIPSSAPCSWLITANALQSITDSINSVSENLLFDNIDDWLERAKPPAFSHDDSIDDSVSKTIETRTPIALNRRDVQSLLDNEILMVDEDSEVSDFEQTLPNPSPKPTRPSSTVTDPSKWASPHKIQYNVTRVEDTENLFLYNPGDTGLVTGYGFFDQTLDMLGGFRDTLSACEDYRQEYIDLREANSGEDIDPFITPCTEGFDGWVYRWFNRYSCYRPFQRIGEFPVYLTPEDGVNLTHELETDIQTEEEEIDIPEAILNSLEPATVYAELFRTNRPIFGNSITTPYPQLVFYKTFESTPQNFAQYYVSQYQNWLYYRNSDLNRFKSNKTKIEILGNVTFTATVPMFENSDYGFISETSCPVGLVDRNYNIVRETTGFEWDDSNVDPDVEPENPSEVTLLIDQFNWEYDAETESELVNRGDLNA